jgi:hypothetical protein
MSHGIAGCRVASERLVKAVLLAGHRVPGLRDKPIVYGCCGSEAAGSVRRVQVFRPERNFEFTAVAVVARIAAQREKCAGSSTVRIYAEEDTTLRLPSACQCTVKCTFKRASSP